MSNTRHSLKWQGQEITSTWGRALAASIIFLSVPLIIIIALLSVPLHLCLRALGRQGFLIEESRGEWSYNVSAQGFRRAA